MDVLFLCGVFAKENEVEVIAQAKKSVEFSANQMQLKLIRGSKPPSDLRTFYRTLSESEPQFVFFWIRCPTAFMQVCPV